MVVYFISKLNFFQAKFSRQQTSDQILVNLKDRITSITAGEYTGKNNGKKERETDRGGCVLSKAGL